MTIIQPPIKGLYITTYGYDAAVVNLVTAVGIIAM